MRRSQHLIAATVLICAVGACSLAAPAIAWAIGIRAICWISSTPRKSCRANASRFSPKACRVSSRVCRKELYKGSVEEQHNSISRTPQLRPLPRRLRAEEPKTTKSARPNAAVPRPRLRMPRTQPDQTAPANAAAPPPLPEAQENRPQAHHRAAAGPAGRTTGAAADSDGRNSHPPRHSRRRCRAAAFSVDSVSSRLRARQSDEPRCMA